MPTEQELRGQWGQVSGAVKERYGEITDDDLKQTEGSAQKLIGLIQEKSGQSREQVESFVRDVTERTVAGYRTSTQAVADRPAESVAAAFAVGVVLGLTIGLSIASRRQPDPTWRDRLWSSN